MDRLPSPATGVEMYLAAILEELRALRADLADGGQDRSRRVQELLHEAPQPEQPTASPTKRTRTRAARAS